MKRFAIVVSSFNPEVTGGLLEGALVYFREQGLSDAQLEVTRAPGAFETPLIAQKLAKTGRYDGVVCLGAVIKGDTAHFEFISLGASMGIMQAMLQTEVPIAFGVLTTYDDEQAVKRAAPGAHNKGREAAAACYETSRTLQTISK